MLNSYNPSYYTIAYHGMARKIDRQQQNSVSQLDGKPYKPPKYKPPPKHKPPTTSSLEVETVPEFKPDGKPPRGYPGKPPRGEYPGKPPRGGYPGKPPRGG